MNKFNITLNNNSGNEGLISQVRDLRRMFACPHEITTIVGLQWLKKTCDEMREKGQVVIQLPADAFSVFMYNYHTDGPVEFYVGEVSVPEPEPTIIQFERA